jgi:hypothetical protein
VTKPDNDRGWRNVRFFNSFNLLQLKSSDETSRVEPVAAQVENGRRRRATPLTRPMG